MSICRDCAAAIRFVKLDTGRSIPVEPHGSHNRGRVAARPDGAGRLHGYMIRRDRPAQPGFLHYIPHRASCKPDAPKVTAQERTPSLFDRNRTTPQPGPPRPRTPTTSPQEKPE